MFFKLTNSNFSKFTFYVPTEKYIFAMLYKYFVIKALDKTGFGCQCSEVTE